MHLEKNKVMKIFCLSAILFIQSFSPIVAMEEDEFPPVDLDALSPVPAAPTTVLKVPQAQDLQPVEKTGPINVDNGGRWRTRFSIKIGDTLAASESFPLLSASAFQEARLTPLETLEDLKTFNPNKVHFDMALDVGEFTRRHACSDSNVATGALTFIFSIDGEKKAYTIPLKSADDKLLFFVSGHNSGTALSGEMRGDEQIAYTTYKYPKDRSNNAHYLMLLAHLRDIFSASSPRAALYEGLESEILQKLVECLPQVEKIVAKEKGVLKSLSSRILSLAIPLEEKPDVIQTKSAEFSDLSQQLKSIALTMQETLPKGQRPAEGMQSIDLLAFLDSEEYMVQHLFYNIKDIFTRIYEEVKKQNKEKAIQVLGIISETLNQRMTGRDREEN